MALPRDLNEVVAIVRACRQHRVPVIPRGTGTGTVGGAVPLHGGIVLSLARMNRIVALLPDDRCAVVQPGVINNHLQQALAPHGLFGHQIRPVQRCAVSAAILQRMPVACVR